MCGAGAAWPSNRLHTLQSGTVSHWVNVIFRDASKKYSLKFKNIYSELKPALVNSPTCFEVSDIAEAGSLVGAGLSFVAVRVCRAGGVGGLVVNAT